MNYINYFNHTTYTPDTYHRRYDFDFPKKDVDSWEIQQAKRIAILALPFVSLYRPFGSIISISVGSCRVISNFDAGIGETALAVVALATTIFNFRAGLLITTTADLIQEVMNLFSYISKQEYSKTGEEALQILASGLYFSFIVTGALELILLSILVQAVICTYQARHEFAEGRYLEAFAKFALAGVRLYQVNNYRVLIERRNQLFALEKYKKLLERVFKGREARHLIHHPLSDLQKEVKEKQVTLSKQDFGSHFHGHGKGLVKGANIAFRRLLIAGKEITELEFKVNHVFREKLQRSLEDLTKLDRKEIGDLLSITPSHIEDIQVIKSADEHQIQLKGLGSICIGSEAQLPNLYDKVIIQMDSDKTIYDLHEILAFANLEEAICVSTKEDLDRLKMGHLFRTFVPKEALPFERTEEFFTLPLDLLKEKIVEKAPLMEGVFTTYFDRMGEAEILPGRVRYQIHGLAEKVHEVGGRALTAAVTGAYSDDIELYERVASMLHMGMISHELKDTYHLDALGLSSGLDYWTGGADSVYTQMLTEQNVKDKLDLSQLYYSKARMLISLEALEMGTYQYYDDLFGTRQYEPYSWWWGSDTYRNHPDIIEFTKQLQQPTCLWQYDRNEVMLKERIDPYFFKGLILDSEKTRLGLLNHLRTRDLVQQDAAGRETILNIDVDRFLRVGKFATEELLR